MGLKYQPSDGSKKKGALIVEIRQAKDLPAMDGHSSTDSAVKLHLLPNRKSSGKRKTGVIKNNLNPVWEERFTYEDVSLEELSRERVLEVSVWNYDKSGNRFIGGLRLGPAPGSAEKHKDWMDSIGDEVTQWEDTLAHPGKWVEQWHTLRTSLDPRSVDLQPPSYATVTPHPIPPPPTVVEESVSSSPVLLEDEFKKTAPSGVSPVEHPVQASVESAAHKEHTTESVAALAAEYEQEHTGIVAKPPAVSDEHTSKHEPPTNNSSLSKPIFSSSVRTRPSVTPVQASVLTRDVKKVDVTPPKEDVKTSSPPRDHRINEEEAPTIRVEDERMPPQATSTPVGKRLDLSELSAYRDESPESVGSHDYQVSFKGHCVTIQMCVRVCYNVQCTCSTDVFHVGIM